jgi:hypothetical protein
MTVTIELPDDESFKAALRFQALGFGQSVEDYCAGSVIGWIEAEARFDSPLAKICQQWQKRLQEKVAAN